MGMDSKISTFNKKLFDSIKSFTYQSKVNADALELTPVDFLTAGFLVLLR